MPGQFLTEAERERLSSFPAEVIPGDVIAYFTLADADRAFVLTHRADLIINGNRCNSSCLRGNNGKNLICTQWGYAFGAGTTVCANVVDVTTQVSGFLSCVQGAGLRWGGNFNDPVHIDDLDG